MPTDAVVVLKDDHQKLRKLFDDFKTANPNATVTKRKISKNIIEQLTIHTYLHRLPVAGTDDRALRFRYRRQSPAPPH